MLWWTWKRTASRRGCLEKLINIWAVPVSCQIDANALIQYPGSVAKVVDASKYYDSVVCVSAHKYLFATRLLDHSRLHFQSRKYTVAQKERRCFETVCDTTTSGKRQGTFDGSFNPAYKLWVDQPHAGQRIATAEDLFCTLLVTCYAEGEAVNRGTLESLSSTTYPSTHKLLFVVADGLVTGSALSTPETIINLIDIHPLLNDSHDLKYYSSVGDGINANNQGKVVQIITGVNASANELVLMVDADTKVATDSLEYMILAHLNDEKLMGVCGDTRFGSKTQSPKFKSEPQPVLLLVVLLEQSLAAAVVTTKLEFGSWAA
ncbi:chitin synthase-domain-containing protein [Zopfochytrium polystomum]|nr:chitin synthase-domain-containing protein [Zopfochytrium polystomum]